MYTPCNLFHYNQMLSFGIRNDKCGNTKLPCTALPVFHSPEYAIKFRDEVINKTDTSSYDWSVSLSTKSKEATFCTSIKRNYEFSNERPVYPKKLDLFCENFTDQLIGYKIGCLFIEDYHFDQGKDRLKVDGILWLPTLKEN